MKEYYSRKGDNEILEQVKADLQNGEQVEWHNKHETFYGWDWLNWIKEELQDVKCTIETTRHDHLEGFPSVIVITPEK